MELSIYFSISWSELWPLPDLFAEYWNYSVWISIQVVHHLLCSFISFLWRKLYDIFDHLLYFSSDVFDQSCKLGWVSIWVFNLFWQHRQRQPWNNRLLPNTSTSISEAGYWFTSLLIISPIWMSSFLLRLIVCC